MTEKKFTLKNKRGYFVFENFFEDKDACDFLIVISIRGSGKTTGAMCLALENWFKYKKRFVWCRRKKVEIDQIKADIVNFNKYKWKGKKVEIFRSADKIFVLQDGKKELVGWLVSLSTFYNIKGRDFIDCSLFIFDEFMDENNVYLMEEWRVFTNTLSTVQRNRTPFKVMLLGNNIDPFNLYIQKFQFEINNEDMFYEKINKNGYKTWLINDRDLKTLHKEYENTSAYNLAMLDRESEAYLIKGDFRERNMWLCSTIAYHLATPQYNFYLFDHAFHTRVADKHIYLVKGLNEKCQISFGLTQGDQLKYNLKTYDFHLLALQWNAKMRKRQLWFDDHLIFDLVIQWFRNFKPKEAL